MHFEQYPQVTHGNLHQRGMQAVDELPIASQSVRINQYSSRFYQAALSRAAHETLRWRRGTMAISFELVDLTQKECRDQVGWFFRNESERLGCMPMLFNFERWGQCDEAVIAQKHREILGLVTLASKGIQGSGRPTLDTLYVPKANRMTGLGYALFEQGIRRLIERGASGMVFCQLQSSIMLRLVAKLPDDLKGYLQIHEAFQEGDLAEEFDDLEHGFPE